MGVGGKQGNIFRTKTSFDPFAFLPLLSTVSGINNQKKVDLCKLQNHSSGYKLVAKNLRREESQQNS